LRPKKGFTLVEVIVVLVILAILAAIAIPALTGYIAKAEDERYKLQARDAIMAFRSVIDEDYSIGNFNAAASAYLDDGIKSYNSTAASKPVKYFAALAFGNLVDHGNNNYVSQDIDNIYLNKTAKLMGTQTVYKNAPGYWHFSLYSPNNDNYNFLNAPWYRYLYFPDGENANSPVIVVTFGIDLTPASLTNNSFSGFMGKVNEDTHFSMDVGYRVFHLTFDNYA
jgi:prepilin-type N-terminal cleavage/methylation domain-containing protein